MKMSGLLILFVLSVLVSPVSNYANEKENSLVQNAFIVFPENLKSDCPGVVESTIYDIVVLKQRCPQVDYSKFVNKLNKIAENNEDPSIRFKAHLASIYLSFSDLIEVKPIPRSPEHDYIFKQINEQLKSKLLASN